MIAQTLFGKKNLKIVQREIPTVNKGEVLVSVKACGVCRSDIEFYRYGKVGSFEVQQPIVLGHEAAGIIAGIGEDVTDLEVGDRVAIDPLMNCGKCDPCSIGLENLCVNKRFLAAPPCSEGCFQEFLSHPGQLVTKLEGAVSLEEAALIEPSSVAYNAAEKTGALTGHNRIGIVGAGSIGLILCKVLNLNRDNKISIYDTDENRVSFAQKCISGVEGFVVGSGNAPHSRDLEIGFDTSGTEEGINMLLHMMVPRGRIGCIGWGKEFKRIDFHRIVLDELAITGCQVFTHSTFRTVAKLLNEEKLNLKGVFKTGYRLDELERAFLVVDNKEVREPKVIVTI